MNNRADMGRNRGSEPSFAELEIATETDLNAILDDSAIISGRFRGINALLKRERSAGLAVCAVLTHRLEEEEMCVACLRYLHALDKSLAYQREKEIAQLPSSAEQPLLWLNYQWAALELLYRIAPDDALEIAGRKMHEEFGICALRDYCSLLVEGKVPRHVSPAPGSVPPELQALYGDALTVFLGGPGSEESLRSLQNRSPILADLFRQHIDSGLHMPEKDPRC